MDNLENYISDILENKLKWNGDLSFKIIPLTKGGSERNFYRILFDNKSVVYMHYTDEKEENKFYYDIAKLFQLLGINIAEICYKDDGNIFLQDLGDVHLYNLVTRYAESKNVNYYYNAVNQMLKLHLHGALLYEKRKFKISGQFDYTLYRWESSYFYGNLIDNYCKLKLDKTLKSELESDFHFLADVLSKEKTCLIHRDCQSKNIMVNEGKVYFIDFQGLRYGLAQYDLASLLEDPYVDLSQKFKDDILDYYISKLPNRIEKQDFYTIYTYCAIQRLMQALGAYAFLGLKKNKKEFLEYIPSALKKLTKILDVNPLFTGLKGLIELIFVKNSLPLR